MRPAGGRGQNETAARGRNGRPYREGEPGWLLLRVRAALHDHPREEDDVDEKRDGEAEETALRHRHELHRGDEIPTARVVVHVDDGFLQRRQNRAHRDVGIVVAAVARRKEPVGRPLFKRQTEGIVRFEGAALHEQPCIPNIASRSSE